jgi:hypothetical protein
MHHGTDILVFSEKLSSRLTYILNVLLNRELGLNALVTTNTEEFEKHEGVKLNYSSQSIDNTLQIIPQGILFDYGIKDYFIEVQTHEVYQKVFFKNSKLSIPFDLFGAAFWLLSRYEEYLPFKGNRYHVFDYRNSLAWQNNFLDVPLVNLWTCKLRDELFKKFPTLGFKNRPFSFKVTVDIDSAYKFKHKGIARSFAGIISDIWRRQYKQLTQRIQTLFFNQKDEYDCYDFLIEAGKPYRRNILYFFLLGDYGLNDKNHSANNLKYRQLIQHLADYSETGIHPSFASNGHLQQLKIEMARLRQIVHTDVVNSRQHFGILHFPNTYQHLIQAGISNDYSLGYTNINGFRASMAAPFPWYDLRNEEESALILHPFCMNDVAIESHARKNSEKPIDVFLYYLYLNKHYGGELVMIFHNDVLANTEAGRKWQNFYKQILELLNA